ncbi:MAG: 30S ribosome-binding factor RbfA [Gammaproteobacteria bacterium]|nr:30S ribosome-binding factor RbfA [Gammaproteobacteria bacterium]MCP4475912.1 30S ribosome-binding factor RbfA [Gammaproteobacteria bacterium]
MNLATNRSYRIADLVQSILARVLQQEINDPRISGVSIVSVEMSRDLSLAKVYFTLHDAEQLPQAVIGLKCASRFLRRRLAQESEMRYTPKIRFYHDDSLVKGARIDTLLDDIEQE